MTDGTDNNGGSPKPAAPAFKRFAGAKLVPLPMPIAQSNDKESFPVFLGVGIVLSMAVLVTVFILSFTSAKKNAHPVPPPTPGATPASTAHQ
jgi:hypothetical protein